MDVSSVSPSSPHRASVKHVFVHSRSYLGGEYGLRGGYDLTLLRSFASKKFFYALEDALIQKVYLPRKRKATQENSNGTYIFWEKYSIQFCSPRLQGGGGSGAGARVRNIEEGALRSRLEGVELKDDHPGFKTCKK